MIKKEIGIFLEELRDQFLDIARVSHGTSPFFLNAFKQPIWLIEPPSL